MFYVDCHRLTTILLLYPSLGHAVNGALAELLSAVNTFYNSHEAKYFPIELY